MKRRAMQKALEELNENWGLDFVSHTAGNCCNTCGDMETEEKTKQWNEAITYLVIKWFFAGGNHLMPFHEKESLFIKYNLGDLSISQVCKDLANHKEIQKHFIVIEPESDFFAIELRRK